LLALALIYKLTKKYLTTNLPTLKTIILVITGLTVTLFIMGFVDNILRNTALQFILWSLIGSLFAVLQEEKNLRNMSGFPPPPAQSPRGKQE
jgi:hypothetical protein